jgi:uncharacterized membrane protein (DUF485 family)
MTIRIVRKRDHLSIGRRKCGKVAFVISNVCERNRVESQQSPDDLGVPIGQDPSIRHNERIGLTMFAVYCAFYAGFVYLVAFAPETMKQTWAGVNYAIIYGMALIIAAIVLAIAYVMVCRTPTDSSAG